MLKLEVLDNVKTDSVPLKVVHYETLNYDVYWIYEL